MMNKFIGDIYYDKYIVMYHICEHKEHTHILELFNGRFVISTFTTSYAELFKWDNSI